MESVFEYTTDYYLGFKKRVPSISHIVNKHE